jgi:hypothetical protein
VHLHPLLHSPLRLHLPLLLFVLLFAIPQESAVAVVIAFASVVAFAFVLAFAFVVAFAFVLAVILSEAKDPEAFHPPNRLNLSTNGLKPLFVLLFVIRSHLQLPKRPKHITATENVTTSNGKSPLQIRLRI